MKKLFYLSFLSTVLLISNINAQKNYLISNYSKKINSFLQLRGSLNPNRSLLINSINNIIVDNDTLNIEVLNMAKEFNFINKKAKLVLLPVNLINQFNSHHPEGINDGSMIPSKGFQSNLKLGFKLEFGPLEIQLYPELIYAKNNSFAGFPSNYKTRYGIQFPDNPNRSQIDYPERFGDKIFRKVFWGQSSIRLNFSSFSVGLSNENLWWGPGYRNSLVMTNNTPGFMHLTFNTTKPVNIGIGYIEGQIIAGRIEGSKYTKGLRDDWRYINAMIMSYNPKWIKGLFLGFSRSFIIYHEDIGSKIGDYFPIFTFLSKSKVSPNVDADKTNQIFSVFMRWLFTEAKGEIYFEYGRDDHSWNTRDFILEPSHSSAYILGLRKLFDFNKSKDSYIMLILESTHLSLNQTTINRYTKKTPDLSWYEHTGVRHGYTHQGQLLGAGIGPGSNLQTIDISWCQDMKQIGLRFERYVHNNDFWYEYIKDIRANWVDISCTAYANWDYKNLLLSAKLKYVKSRNYQWLYEPEIDAENPQYWMPGDPTYNFHVQIGITYWF